MSHGDLDYPVLGETNETSGELVWAIKVAFPLLPDVEVISAVEELRAANDLYGVALDDLAAAEEPA